jgi:serine/threonine protein kinase
LHRDLTPANIMVVGAGTLRETIKVMDFGLALMNEGVYIPLEKLTGGAKSIGGGTPDFVPPEQVRGDTVDHRGDLYSVGVTLFKLLTGYLPFEKAQSVDDILQAHLRETPPKFAQLGITDVPAGVEMVVQTLLCKYPAERPADAKELAERYGKALGKAVAPASAFVVPDHEVVAKGPKIDPRSVLDHLEAWMPEQIAVMKLRGFADGVGGQVVDSQRGVIRIRLRDPDSSSSAKSQGFLSWLGFGKQPADESGGLFLDLHLEKRQRGSQNLIEILVTFRTDQQGAKGLRQREHAERLCKDLRAYLICR